LSIKLAGGLLAIRIELIGTIGALIRPSTLGPLGLRFFRKKKKCPFQVMI
jgi:hypothetical protein